ncbi:MAG: NACHT domain-containing protein [Proteobacteria bacterium]|nr:NACHT domain-containing protein [Pseudomonadota bacterium]
MKLSIVEWTALIERIKNNDSALKSFNFKDNKIGGVGAKEIARALEKNTTLTSLDLGNNQIGAAGAKEIAKALEKNKTLTTLSFGINEISDAGATEIARVLEKNATLTSLIFGKNQIGEAGTTEIARAVEKNTTLTTLFLADNQISDAGATEIARALEKNTALTLLSLGNNEIGDAGAIEIGRALEKNTTLAILDLTDNQIGAVGAKEIAGMLEKNMGLTDLCLWKNQIGDAGATEIARALEKNMMLTSLHLADNEIGDAGAKEMARALKHNRTIMSLCLLGNKIGEVGEEIERALERNRSLSNDFKEAIMENELPKVKKLVSQGVSLIYKDTLWDHDKTPLEFALSLDNKEIFIYLVEEMKHRNISINPKDLAEYQSLTRDHPLLYACWKGTAESIQKIIIELRDKAQTELNLVDSSGWTRLHDVCRYQDKEAIILVLEALDFEASEIVSEQISSIDGKTTYTAQEILALNPNPTCKDINLNELIEEIKAKKNQKELQEQQEKVKEIVKAIENNTTPTTLHFCAHPMDAIGVKIAMELDKNNMPVSLEFVGYNQKGSVVATEIARALEKNTTLTSLSIWLNEISDAGTTEMAKALERNTTLTKLDLTCTWGEFDLLKIAGALEKNTMLTDLKLSSNQIGGAGAIEMAKALERNTTLTKLDLRCAWIGEFDLPKIARALEKNTTLTDLKLSSNQIGDTGAIEIARVLEKNKTLAKLGLRSNQISDLAAIEIGKVLEKNTALTILDLGSNQISDTGVTAIARELEKNTTLAILDLGYNQIGDAGAKEIAKALENNTTLLLLGLWENQISDAGAKEIARALEKNKTLIDIGFSRKEISDAVAKEIAKALERNRSLRNDFKEAIKKNELSKVKELVNQGASLVGNIEGWNDDQAPIELALSLNTKEIFIYLVEELKHRNISIGPKDLEKYKSFTQDHPLLYACWKGTTESIRKIIAELGDKAESEISLPDSSGWTRLHDVCRYQDKEAVILILETLGFKASEIASKQINSIDGKTTYTAQELLALNPNPECKDINLNEPIAEIKTREVQKESQKHQRVKQTLTTRVIMKLGTEKWIALIARIKNNDSTLTSLDLRNKQIGDVGVKEIVRVLESNTTLMHLKLRRNQISGTGATEIARALEKNTTLTSLDLEENQIGEAGAREIARALEKNTTLTSLDLGFNRIGAVGAGEIARGLEKNTTLTNLNLRSNQISEVGTKEIAKALEKNTTLMSLNLSWNQIGDIEAKEVAKALESNMTLTSLSLWSNEISDAGATEIARALEKNTTLTSLDLSYNQIGAVGATEIARALKKNKMLVGLGLGVNCISDAGATEIARALKKNTTLVYLDLERNQIGAAVIEIRRALEKNRTLESLKLGLNQIDDTGAIEIARVLESNTILMGLDLSWNKIGAVGVTEIIRALEKNKTLMNFYLGYNKIGDTEAKEIKNVLERNKALSNAFKEAIMNNELSKIKELVNQGISLVGKFGGWDDEKTPLELALSLGNKEVFIYLVEEMKHRKISISPKDLEKYQEFTHKNPLLTEEIEVKQENTVPTLEKVSEKPANVTDSLVFPENLNVVQSEIVIDSAKSNEKKLAELKETVNLVDTKKNKIRENAIQAKVETFIEETWAKILNLQKPLNKTQKFSEFNGDSEKWHAMLEIVKSHFLVSLEDAPYDYNITKLTKFVSEQIEAKSSMVVRYLPKQGSDSNKKLSYLFVIHPILGGIEQINTLFAHIDKSVLDTHGLGLSVLRSPILDMNLDSAQLKDDEKYLSFFDIKQQAKHAIASMRALKPHGPYYLSGWSYGGILAIEIARQLRAQGEKIKYLGLIDPQTPKRLRDLDEAALRKRLLMHLNYTGAVFMPSRFTVDEKELAAGKKIELIESKQLSDGQSGIELIRTAFDTIFSNLEKYKDESGFGELNKYLHSLKANYYAIYNYHPEELLKGDNKLPAAIVYVAGDLPEKVDKMEYLLNDLGQFVQVKLTETLVEKTTHFDIVFDPKFANLLTKHLEHISEIKLASKFQMHLSRHYSTMDFTTLQFLYDDKCLWVKDLKFLDNPIQTLFQKTDKTHHVLLIGKAGVGKSAFSHKIVLDSLEEENKIWPQKEWVFYIPAQSLLNYFQEKLFPLTSENTIPTLLYHEFFKAAGFELEQVKQFWMYINKTPESICFILDGVDKIISQAQLSGILRNIFAQKASVIVTARDYQLRQLGKLGFSSTVKCTLQEMNDDQITQFIDHYFEGIPSESMFSEDLRKWLKDRPVIQIFCRSPLHLTMICSIWRNLNGVKVNGVQVLEKEIKLSEIMTIYIKNMLRRYLNNSGEQAESELNDVINAEIESQTEQVSKFLKLVAFESIKKGRQILKSDWLNQQFATFNGGKGFSTKVIISGFIQPLGYAMYDVDRDFEFNSQVTRLYFACQHVVNILQSQNDESESILVFIQQAVKEFDFELLQEFLLTSLDSYGLEKLLRVFTLPKCNHYGAKLLKMITYSMEQAYEIGDFNEAVIKALLEKISPVLYCFTGPFAKAYSVGGQQDQPDMSNDDLKNYKKNIDDLKQLCPQLFVEVDNFQKEKCQYDAGDKVLDYAVKKKDSDLLSLILNLDPENTDLDHAMSLAGKNDYFPQGVELIRESADQRLESIIQKLQQRYRDLPDLISVEMLSSALNTIIKNSIVGGGNDACLLHINKKCDEIIQGYILQWKTDKNAGRFNGYLTGEVAAYVEGKRSGNNRVHDSTRYFNLTRHIDSHIIKTYVKDNKILREAFRSLIIKKHYESLKPILKWYFSKELERKDKIFYKHRALYDRLHVILEHEKRNVLSDENWIRAFDELMQREGENEEVLNDFALKAIEKTISSSEEVLKIFNENYDLLEVMLRFLLEKYREGDIRYSREESSLSIALQGLLKFLCEKCYADEISMKVRDKLLEVLQRSGLEPNVETEFEKQLFDRMCKALKSVYSNATHSQSAPPNVFFPNNSVSAQSPGMNSSQLMVVPSDTPNSANSSGMVPRASGS